MCKYWKVMLIGCIILSLLYSAKPPWIWLHINSGPGNCLNSHPAINISPYSQILWSAQQAEITMGILVLRGLSESVNGTRSTFKHPKHILHYPALAQKL
uniref:Uncharacterized protein n=1 Tax=Chelonoidis abingdonii TaxID=106734 RepID=A0A8C0GG73_CHEAB